MPALGDTGPAGAGVPRGLAWQLPRFVVLGIASTLAYVLLYLLLRGLVAAQAANFAALLLTAVGNTAANRRLTFGVRGRAGAVRHQFRGLIAFGAGLALTSGALAALHALSRSPGRGTEVAVLLAATLAATVVRFALYRKWVFGSPPPRLERAPAVAPGSAGAPADIVNDTTGSTR